MQARLPWGMGGPRRRHTHRSAEEIEIQRAGHLAKARIATGAEAEGTHASAVARGRVGAARRHQPRVTRHGDRVA